MTNATELKILIIDDNLAIHQDFRKILKPKKALNELAKMDEALFGRKESNEPHDTIALPRFQIDSASQGLEGIAQIKMAAEMGEPYSLAFVDMRMPPGLDGIQTIKEIWKITPDIQTVICSAYSDYTWEETIKELGMNDNLLILKKPFDVVAVRQLACALTKKWRLLQTINDNTRLLEERVQERTNSLQHSLSLTRATLDSSIDGIIAVNTSGEIVDYNNQFQDIWKMPSHLLSKKEYKACLDFMVDQILNPEEFLEKSYDLNKSADKVYVKSIALKDGRVLEKYSHPQKLNGQTIGRIWSFRDITQRVSLEGKLEFQATHDALTSLPNRVLLRDRVQNAIYRASRDKLLVGILFFDLDRFKIVNDSLGHEAGDELLKGVAERLQTIVRESDTISRLGGDEFVLVVTDLKDEKAIISVANKILDFFKIPFRVAERDIFITASIGVSFYPKDGITVDELIRNADLAMYSAKKAGSDCAHFFTEELNKKAVFRLEMELEMRSALEKKEFFLNYQPQLDLVSNSIVSVEALVRWQHPQKGVISPFDFIPFAEETGIIVPLGEWVLRTACEQCKLWNDNGQIIRIGVNVATAQLEQDNFVETVQNILKETGLKPEHLEIEITENVLFSEEVILKRINDLKTLGIQIALDDFGSGNSCLNYLKKINVDRLKIDQSFVQNIDSDRSDEVIIQAIIDMAQSLNMEVLAEGVETQRQLDFIKSRNCRSVQGYHFGKPMSSDEIQTFFTTFDKAKLSKVE